LRLYLDKIWPKVSGRAIRWLIAPDACGANPLLAWTQADTPEYIFAANTSLEKTSGPFGIPTPGNPGSWELEFSTSQEIPAGDQKLVFNGVYYPVANLAPAEGRVYKKEIENSIV
jgi:hypothetical protein